MQTQPEELSPAMKAAVEALNLHVPGDSFPHDDFYRGEEPIWLPRGREGQLVVEHQRTLAAIASFDSAKWSEQ